MTPSEDAAKHRELVPQEPQSPLYSPLSCLDQMACFPASRIIVLSEKAVVTETRRLAAAGGGLWINGPVTCWEANL